MPSKTLFCVFLFFGALFSGCLNQQQSEEKYPGEGRSYIVLITSNGFKPASLKVLNGASVKWINQDSEPHDVVFLDEESQLLEQGESWEKLFYETGYYGYEDSIYLRYANLSVVEGE